MKSFIISFLLFSLSPSHLQVYAQQEGIVPGGMVAPFQEEPLPGLTVRVENPPFAAGTDTDGRHSSRGQCVKKDSILFLQSAPISLPQGTVEGYLSNGLHYLILKNTLPASKVEFRLIMHVGSVQETENEKGCAHFLEHMAFGGTTHFPKRTLVNYIESFGMKYGIDINAFTGYDRTIYMFPLPTDHGQKTSVDSSLLILRDWLDGISFHPEKVENEKRIILEELREYEPNDDFYPLKIGQGVFGNHTPLGTADDISKITPQVLKEFYRKWYVPSLATLVIVGDVSPKEVEKKIKTVFASLKKRDAQDFRTYPLAYDEGVQIAEVRDTLRKHTKVELLIPHPCVIERTIGDAIRKETGHLLIRAINRRFHARQVKADVSDSWYLSDKNHWVLSVEGKDRSVVLNAITAAVAELNRLAREGWDTEELEDIRTRFCSYLSEGGTEDPRLSSSICDDFTDYILSGDRYITASSERKLVEKAMQGVQSNDLRALLLEWLSYQKKVMLVACNSHLGLGVPLTEQEILKAWTKGEQAESAPYIYVRQEKEEEEPIETPACLAVSPPFDAASIAHFKVYKGLGVSEVKLKNGIRLLMKPTENADSTLYLTSFAPFGTSSLSDEEYPLLEGMGGYMDMGGIAKVDSKLLSDYLFQKKMSLTMTLENHWHGFIGMSSTANALEFFNLIYEKIFAPELKYEDFEEIRQELIENKGKESMLKKMLKRDSGRQLSARINELMGRAIPHSLVDSFAERLNLDSIADFYKKLYARPEGTVYVICGNFNPDSLMRRFVSVFGRIPVSADKTAYAYPRFELPDKTYIEGFPNEHETQILSDYLFYGHYQPCQKNTLRLKLMGDLIRNRLISVLRERESLVYSPYISLFYEGIPWHTFYFDIYVSADERNMKRIDMLLKEILRELKEKKVEEQELQTIKRSYLLAKREALDDASPTDWRTTLVVLLKNGESLADFEQYESCLGSITPANLRKAFKKWINPDNYVLLYLSNKKMEE